METEKPLTPQQALIYHTEEIRALLKDLPQDEKEKLGHELSVTYFHIWEALNNK